MAEPINGPDFNVGCGYWDKHAPYFMLLRDSRMFASHVSLT